MLNKGFKMVRSGLPGFLSALVAFFALSLPLCAEEKAAAMYDDNPPEKILSVTIPEHFPRLCRRFAELLETRHFLQKPFDVDLSRQAWTNYLNLLDYDRTYFLASDIESFLPYEEVLCSALKKGDLTFPIKAFDLFKTRAKERNAFVENLLESEPDFSVDEDFRWKRKDAPWPKDAEEQRDLWRRSVKNELLGRKVSADFAAANKTNSVEKAAVTNGDAAGGLDASEVDKGAREGETKVEVALDGAPSTNVVSVASTTNTPPHLDMSPKAVVSRRYKQFAGIIADADADYFLERFLCAFSQVYDPHSTYMPPTRRDDFDIDMNLSLCGIGATLQSEDGMAKVVKILPGGPADKDKREIRLRDNDKIYAVGQGDEEPEDIVHLPLDKIVKRIRGKKGTKVVLHVISASDPSGSTTKVVDLVRDDIKIEDAAATGRVVKVSSKVLDPIRGAVDLEQSYGYVYLPAFYGSMTGPGDPNYRSCTRDVEKIIASFNPEVEGMILDLRGNGGGSLREAVDLVGSFIRRGPVVLVREPGGIQPLADMNPAVAFSKPLVVMIDKGSASASEIVAAALQDYGRAVVVGDTKSHGKGSVQNVTDLISADPEYGALKITIAAFYRINGSSTQLKGVESDIVLPSIFEYMDLGEEKLPHALPWTSIPPMNYKILYPMGGIIPELAERSKARLTDNQEWKKHLERVSHFKEVSERESVSLQYEKRYALLEADNKVGGDEADEDEEDKEDDEIPEDGIGSDIVLREAFNILADLVQIQGRGITPPSTETSDPGWIFKFFK